MLSWRWIAFAEKLVDKMRLTLFPAGTIIKDSHHRKSPTRNKQNLSLRGNLTSDFVEWICEVVISLSKFYTNANFIELLNFN